MTSTVRLWSSPKEPNERSASSGRYVGPKMVEMRRPASVTIVRASSQPAWSILGRISATCSIPSSLHI